jgi:hypothetical protein
MLNRTPFKYALAAALLLGSAPLQAAFVTETLLPAGTTSEMPSLAFDTAGRPHISYCDDLTRTIQIADWNGSAWSYSGLNHGKNVCTADAPLKIDSNNVAHLVFMSTDGVSYAARTGSAWSSPAIIDSTGSYPSMALGEFSRPHVVYYKTGQLRYAQTNGVSWSFQTLAVPEAVTQTALALDNQNRPHIAYYDATNKDLKYAHWTGSAWQTATVDSADDVGNHCAIAIDSQGRPLISYGDQTADSVKLARWTGTQWAIDVIDTSVFGGYTSLKIGANDKWHLSYGIDLGYAEGIGGNWIKDRDNTIYGYHTDVALTPQGKPVIAHGGSAGAGLFLSSSSIQLALPTAPSGLVVKSRTSTSITWSWQDNESTETAYRVLSGAGANLSGDLPANTVEWTQPNLAPGTSYDVKVEMATPLGNFQSATEQGSTLLATPTDLQISLNAEGAVVLSWSGNGNPAGTTYVVEHSENSVNFTVEVPTRSLSYVLTNPVQGKTNYLRVRSTLNTYYLPRLLFPGFDSKLSPDYSLLRKDLLLKDATLVNALGPVADLETPFPASAAASIAVPLNNNRWQVKTVDPSASPGQRSDLAITPQQKPEIFYAAPNAAQIRFAEMAGHNWAAAGVIDENIRSDGKGFAVAPNGSRLITFTRTLDKKLIFAQVGPDAAATLSTVVSAESNVRDARIKTDASGNKHIAYTNADADGFRYAHSAAGQGAWNVVDAGGAYDKASRFDIAVREGHEPYIIYFETSTFDLRAQHRTSNGWSNEDIDNTLLGGSGMVSAALDAQGRPHVAYCSENSGLLKYARWNGSAWEFSTVENSGACAPSLALDPFGQVYIAYRAADGIKLAARDGAFWTKETVDGLANLDYPSLSFDAGGVAHIAYFDKANNDLKYARGPSFWTTIGGNIFRRLFFQLSGGDVELLIPEGALPPGTNVALSEPASIPPPGNNKATGFSVDVAAAGGAQPAIPATIRFTYHDATVQGLDRNSLVIAGYDPNTGEWTALPTTRDPANKQVSALIGRFTQFQLMAPPLIPSVDNIVAYPNPYQPSQAPGMTFDFLPADAKVSVYTLAGERVAELTVQSNGQAQWTAQNESGQNVASGVYFVHAVGVGGKKTIKVAVQR